MVTNQRKILEFLELDQELLARLPYKLVFNSNPPHEILSKDHNFYILCDGEYAQDRILVYSALESIGHVTGNSSDFYLPLENLNGVNFSKPQSLTPYVQSVNEALRRCLNIPTITIYQYLHFTEHKGREIRNFLRAQRTALSLLPEEEVISILNECFPGVNFTPTIYVPREVTPLITRNDGETDKDFFKRRFKALADFLGV